MESPDLVAEFDNDAGSRLLGSFDSLHDVEEAEDVSSLRLLKLSLLACVNNCVTPVAALLELWLVSNYAKGDQRVNVASYGAVLAIATFGLNVLNFVITVNMSAVGNALGSGSYSLVVSKVRVAYMSSVAAGLLLMTVLLVLEYPLYEIYKLEQPVIDASKTFYTLKVLSVPFTLLQSTSCGILNGYQSLKVSSAVNTVVSILMIISNIVILVGLNGGLGTFALGTFVVSVFGALLSMGLVLFFPPHPEISFSKVCSACSVDDDDDQVDETAEYHIWGYLESAINMIIRSLLLSGSIFLLSIFASRLGTAELSAHAILIQLWTLTSYISDGFADVGTMLGSKLIGMKQTKILRSAFNRLVLMGVLTGTLFSIVFFICKTPIITSFTKDAATAHQLELVWPLLALMQVVNSSVFVYDGLLYSTEEFHLVRNIMLLGCVFWFCPSLYLCSITFGTLLSYWACKAILNFWRCVSAIVLIHLKFYPQWIEEERLAESEGRSLA
eukprot:CAMPEP_0203747022 /NCGR_PEP_ID=MMETSP0098-20131031/2281_1 /ASSEMBLY_ACC=CAM_ASM_000208 /TAXON_ID=96639 /ORGANISM=" , Strain NY0313808BC1" /LENGTH=498 /DNA_ID=CAMNT_0050635305 /DNA_START=363 /DNA_END=1856 /DNA_ORIENTATION=+